MPTVPFDLFELDEHGVSFDDMQTVLERHNAVLSDALKTKLRGLLEFHHFMLEETLSVSRSADRDVYVFHQPSF